MGFVIRALNSHDLPAVRQILTACTVFTSEEVSTALGVMHDGLTDSLTETYLLFGAEINGTLQAYVCVGKIPLTRSTWHLYWIATHPRMQGGGLGRALHSFIEDLLLRRGAERIGAETSSRADYAPTRRFYRRLGYRRVGRIRDFYKRGDDCLILCKVLGKRNRCA
jgi:ribosomal protein S18 acetylase RimI-like enzyme